MGVGLPAPIDAVSGQVGSEGVLPGWRGVPVAAAMAEALGTKVLLDNTANLAALGEFKFGALQGVTNGVFIKASYGVGAGLILGGELFRGSAGTAGEIGHVTIDEDGPVCRCGNRGCLDTFVGAQAVLRAVRDSHGPLTLRDVIHRALDGRSGVPPSARGLRSPHRRRGGGRRQPAQPRGRGARWAGGAGRATSSSSRSGTPSSGAPSRVPRRPCAWWWERCRRRRPTCSVHWRSRTRYGRMRTGPLSPSRHRDRIVVSKPCIQGLTATADAS